MNPSAIFRQIIVPLLIAIAAGFWLLTSLGNGMLWQDEAQTALLARTTLRHGVPIAFDGPNSIPQERGDDYGPHGLWKWHMWLPFYVLAGFFKVFGESTTIARLPFALFGVATVVLSYFTSKAIWRDDKSALLTSVLVLGCIPFALLARQCRYYSPAMFFSLLMLDAYIRSCHGWRRGWIVLAIAATLLFNSHFLYCFSGVAAIGLHAAIWHRDRWRVLVRALIVTAICCTPPTLWLASLNYRTYARGVITWHFLQFQLYTYTKDLLLYVVPYPMLLIPLLCVAKIAWGRQSVRPSLAMIEPWALPILFSVITLVAAAPFTPWPFVRYISPLIVPLLILVARWVIVAFRLNVLLGAASVLLLGLWWPESDYVYELHHRFVGPLEGIVQLLKTKEKPGDVVVTSYEDLSLKFYTTDRVFGGTAGDDLSAARGARWLILRHVMTTNREMPVRNYILNQVSQDQRYKPITLDVPDTPFENREEPEIHLYESATGIPPVVVYELIKGADKMPNGRP